MFALQLFNFFMFLYLCMQPQQTGVCKFQLRHLVVFRRITNIDNIQSNTTQLPNVIRDLVGNNNNRLPIVYFTLLRKVINLKMVHN
jgi:hypothetical protein